MKLSMSIPQSDTCGDLDGLVERRQDRAKCVRCEARRLVGSEGVSRSVPVIGRGYHDL
jgi:hypothetical protein